MRRCAIHGTEINCNTLGECSGLLHGTSCDAAGLDNPEVDHAHDPNEANERLGEFAEVIDDASAPPLATFDEALAQLRMSGVSEENARIMLNAPGSPYYKPEA